MKLGTARSGQLPDLGLRDSTYFLVYVEGELAACGGWSFRRTLFGSDTEGSRDATRLNPATGAARIRAFFVRPRFARKGFGSMLVRHCESAAIGAGFRSLSLGTTLPGQRLYTAHGFVASDPIEYDLGDGMSMLVIPMTKKVDDNGHVHSKVASFWSSGPFRAVLVASH